MIQFCSSIAYGEASSVETLELPLVEASPPLQIASRRVPSLLGACGLCSAAGEDVRRCAFASDVLGEIVSRLPWLDRGKDVCVLL